MASLRPIHVYHSRADAADLHNLAGRSLKIGDPRFSKHTKQKYRNTYIDTYYPAVSWSWNQYQLVSRICGG
jgi:hypothetical protein